MTKIKMPLRGTPPRLMLLDHMDADGEPRAALVRPGRLPLIFPSLTHAVEALRAEMAA